MDELDDLLTNLGDTSDFLSGDPYLEAQLNNLGDVTDFLQGDTFAPEDLSTIPGVRTQTFDEQAQSLQDTFNKADQLLLNERFIRVSDGATVTGAQVKADDPGFFESLKTGVIKFAKENPVQAAAAGLGILTGVPLLLKGLLAPSANIPPLDTSRIDELLNRVNRGSTAAEPAFQQGLSKFQDVLGGNFSPGLEDANAVRQRANDLILKALGSTGEDLPDPDVARRIEEERTKLIQNGIQPGSSIMNDFNRQAAIALEQSKTTVKGQKLAQFQSLAGPREQNELARRSDEFKNILAGIQTTNPATVAGNALPSLADLSKSQAFISGQQADLQNKRNQMFANAGGSLIGFGLSPAFRKIAGQTALF